MPKSEWDKPHQHPNPDAESQPIFDQTSELAESRLNQALDQLDELLEHQTYTRETEALDGARMDYDNAWKAFLHTKEGCLYNESNQRHQSAKNHFQRTLEKVTGTYHFQNYIVAEDHRTDSTKEVATAEERAVASPEYRQTAEYQQLNQRHQSILDRCRQAWHDISHTLEGKDYHRAKVQFDKTEREVSLVWARSNQTPQGQRLTQIMDKVDRLEQSCQQAEKAYKLTPAYIEYAEATKAHRQQTLNNPAPVEEKAKIIPIKDLASQSYAHPVKRLSVAA